MKNMKKILALILAMLLIVANVAALADNTNTTVTTAADKGKGDFSITMTGAEAGHTFKAYRIFDGSVDTNGKLGDIDWATGVNTTDIAAALTTAGLATSIEEGGKTVTLDLSKASDVAKAMAKQNDDSEVMKKVADVFYARKGTETGSVSDKTGDNYVITGQKAGYYLVTDEYTDPENVGEGAATLSRNVLAVVGDVTAVVKNDKPTVEKKILDPDPVDANEAGVGETVVYQITGSVPNWVGYDKYFYVINDTLSSGLTFNADSVVVKVGDTIQTPGTDYVLYTGDQADGHTFQVAFKDIKSKTVGQPITVTYNAVVNSNAVIGNPGNPNEVDLIYSNNPNDSSDGNPSENPKPGEDHPTGKTPKDKTITFVAELDLTKYKDAIGEGNELQGATFLLDGTSNVPKGSTAEKYVEDSNGTFYKLKDDSFTTTAPHGDILRSDGSVEIESNEDDYDSTTQKYKLTNETSYTSETKTILMQGTSGADGKIVFKGLGAGTYTIKEIVTPQGYTTAADITFTISVTVPDEIKTGSETASWTTNNEDVTVGETTGIYATNVIDLSGTVLPSTGGIGTTIFYVGGGILVLLAVILLVTKRRMSSND